MSKQFIFILLLAVNNVFAQDWGELGEDGKSRVYHHNGNVRYLIDYVVDSVQGHSAYNYLIKEGHWKEYYPTGELASQFSYHNDTMVGDYVRYHQNGVVKEKGIVIHENPQWEKQFDEIGVLISERVVYQYSDNLPELTDEQREIFAIKHHLNQKFNPGTCYGMPDMYELWYMVMKHPLEASFVKSESIINPSNYQEKQEIINRILRLVTTDLSREEDGYTFEVVDGGCCHLKLIRGTVKVVNGEFIVEVTETEDKQVPC